MIPVPSGVRVWIAAGHTDISHRRMASPLRRNAQDLHDKFGAGRAGRRHSEAVGQIICCRDTCGGAVHAAHYGLRPISIAEPLGQGIVEANSLSGVRTTDTDLGS